MTKRIATPKETETRILVDSGRRCCLCVGLVGDLSEKRGQIVHLDHDPSNTEYDNLAYLCLPHHDQYDSKTSQSKGLTISEAKHYRSLLYSVVVELRKQQMPARDDAGHVKKRQLVRRAPSKTYAPRWVGKDAGSSRGVVVNADGREYNLLEYLADTELLMTDLYPEDYDETNSSLTWGYRGTGPHNTAYSILRDLFGFEIAKRYYISFLLAIIQHLPTNSGWLLTSAQIEQWLESAPDNATAQANWFKSGCRQPDGKTAS